MFKRQSEVLDVTAWDTAGQEAVGVDEKIWLIESDSTRKWLFKPVTTHPHGCQGEDWSEKLAQLVAGELEVPAARVELAVRAGVRGCASLSMIPAGWEMQHGAVLLGEYVRGYVSRSSDRRGHNLANIRAVLRGMAGPDGYGPATDMSAFDVFAGYTMLDAVIANRDRHDENWAVLRNPLGDEPATLAPSYDHATSLGFNLLDAKRSKMITSRTVDRWARRADAHRFEKGPQRRPTLIELAAAALRAAGSGACIYWLDRLDRLDQASSERWCELVDEVGVMSDPAGTFAVELLKTNARRLLDECSRRPGR